MSVNVLLSHAWTQGTSQELGSYMGGEKTCMLHRAVSVLVYTCASSSIREQNRTPILCSDTSVLVLNRLYLRLA